MKRLGRGIAQRAEPSGTPRADMRSTLMQCILAAVRFSWCCVALGWMRAYVSKKVPQAGAASRQSLQAGLEGVEPGSSAKPP